MKIYIETLGCPKNEADSRVLSGMFRDRSHELTDDIEAADIAVINTCGFILDAAQESIDTLVYFSTNLKKQNSRLRVYGMGCLIQRYQEELMKEIPEIDGWIGIDTLENTVDFILEREKKVLIPDIPNPTFFKMPERYYVNGDAHAYVKIGDGCNRACEFCSIPTFKGGHVSRSPEDIVKECRQLVESGKKELIIVDQDVTQYNANGVDLKQLIAKIDAIEGDYWIRLMYMHPDHIDDELFLSLKETRHVIPYFDIPVQHGSNTVLKNMGRIRTAEELKKRLNFIRELFPDAVLRTTIMLGFPGEGDEEFEKLKTFMQDVEFDKVGFFKFSMEEGTPISFRDVVIPDEDIVDERFEEINDIQREISVEKNERLVGKELTLIVDGTEEDLLLCRSYREAPEIDSEIFIELNTDSEIPERGTTLKARIIAFAEYDLEAEII
ncbi:MAG TPA: 30S ribosomal protein S12 methylthiotransferase RimO [Thermotogota bacterium]|nr:30S ribosomal protein S12 methylthiotransferase RimO [Thermotogota bacterium]HPJ88099.1 30S ribosomal protein S12 methylthiotransferase RimO [Thermotogota bacterium]HPR96041.1 30S ribosomal protein S12 methylthiotransferase RimO [Thermotogota bacterium]